jgi:translation initiation factor IF-2
MRLTTAAINAGVRPGERAPAPVVVVPPRAAPSPRERDARQGRGDRFGDRNARTTAAAPGRAPEPGLHGTVGETATPQTTYTPPTDVRRGRPGRGPAPGGARRGGGADARRGGGGDARGGRFDREQPARALTLEDRIKGSIGVGVEGTELKSARLVEGSTVKEFAEKLGIKPKDVVALLLQRGVFATINQPLNDDVAIELGKRFGFEVLFVPFEEMIAEEEFEELVATDADDVELHARPSSPSWVTLTTANEFARRDSHNGCRGRRSGRHHATHRRI